MLNLIQPGNAVWKPLKIILYGVHGIGKNTLASTFERPVVLATEDGNRAFDTPTLPLATTFTQITEAIQALHGEHNYKTLVLDSLDWLEPIVWQATCTHFGKDSIESFGFGKGYVELDKFWQYVMGGLDSLREQKGMDIVVLAHSEIKTIIPPDTDSFDCYQMKMQKRAFALWQEWSDITCFMAYKVNISKTVKGDSVTTRGTGTGDRIIHTAERPAYKAKSRWPLPEEIIVGKDKTWIDFHKALNAATDGKYAMPSHYSKK